jgi:hypothetical protein
MHRCNDAPRCRAKSKRTGLPCRSPAVNGYRVCRMPGAGGGAPEGEQNAGAAISSMMLASCFAELAFLKGLHLKPGTACIGCAVDRYAYAAPRSASQTIL